MLQEQLQDFPGQAPFFKALQVFLVGDDPFQGLDRGAPSRVRWGPRRRRFFSMPRYSRYFLNSASSFR